MALFQVLIISLEIWTAVTCNETTEINITTVEALQQQLRKSELESKQYKIYYERTVIKLVRLHLQHGDVNSALDEFLVLRNKDALIEELVQCLYSDSKLKLQHLTQFVCKINFFTASYVAINTLYLEIMKKNQSEENEVVVALYYGTENLIRNTNFTSQSSVLKINLIDLNTKITPDVRDKIMSLLLQDIENGEFERPNLFVNITRLCGSEELFLVDLVTLYLTRTSLAQFSKLYKFVNTFKLHARICHAYAVIWKKLQARGAVKTMEALAVWFHASEITIARNILNTQCMEIASRTAPEYKQILFANYSNYIENGLTNSTRDLHEKYHLKYFFIDYISSQNVSFFQNENFNKLFDTINNLPSSEDICFAVYAVSEHFKSYQMRGTFEHFQILKIVKEMKSQENYATMDALAKSKCEGVAKNMPPVFNQVLYGDASRCKLINRVHYGHALTSTCSRDMEHKYRIIYTSPDEDSDDQCWTLELPELNHGINFRNFYFNDVHMRFIYDKS